MGFLSRCLDETTRICSEKYGKVSWKEFGYFEPFVWILALVQADVTPVEVRIAIEVTGNLRVQDTLCPDHIARVGVL